MSTTETTGTGCVGRIPPPPPGIEERRALASRDAADGGGGTTPHHWQAGPADIIKLAKPRRLRLRDGSRATATHEYRWYLDRVEGTTRRQATKRLYDVFLHPQGWIRAGVHMRRVFDRAAADLWVRVIPQDTTRCGPGSIGCYSWGFEPKPVAEHGVEHIASEGTWLVLVGMESVAHAVYRMHDGYANHTGYEGSLGSWQSAAAFGFLPSEAEIEGAKRWLVGETPNEYIHDHG